MGPRIVGATPIVVLAALALAAPARAFVYHSCKPTRIEQQENGVASIRTNVDCSVATYLASVSSTGGKPVLYAGRTWRWSVNRGQNSGTFVSGPYRIVVTFAVPKASWTSCPAVTASWNKNGPWHVRDTRVLMSITTAKQIATRLPVIEGGRVKATEVPCGVGYSVASTMGPYWTAGYGIATVKWRAEGVSFPLGKFQCNSSGAHVKWPVLACRHTAKWSQDSITVSFEIGPA